MTNNMKVETATQSLMKLNWIALCSINGEIAKDKNYLNACISYITTALSVSPYKGQLIDEPFRSVLTHLTARHFSRPLLIQLALDTANRQFILHI